MTRFSWLTAAALLCACAGPQPVVYPNAHFQQVGPDQAKADVSDCQGKAKHYLKDHKAEIVAGHTVIGAARANTPDAVTKRFVNQCLTEKGYQSIGWR